MPLPTPFHRRTSSLCTSREWREWAGYFSAITYGPTHDIEYAAIRNAAGLIDISPLYKYEIHGPDALPLLNRIMTRDVARCHVGQMMYSPWCDDNGKVIDDGTEARLAENTFRVTAADPNLRWFQDCGFGMDIEIKDVSATLAALALQGPQSRKILEAISPDGGWDTLKYYRVSQVEIGGNPVTVSRTGYTGDLGYELWIAAEHAESVWDEVLNAGKEYGLVPVGLAALDIARIEAGMLLIEVDYTSAQRAITEAEEYSPYDLGLGWTVALDKAGFVGRKRLIQEKQYGSSRKFVGLEVDWLTLKELFAEADLPPQVAGRASRSGVPIYLGATQIGQATSMAFSPILKKYIAIGTVNRPHGQVGSAVELEITIEYTRKRAPARIVKTPFYSPEWKRS
jgi:aminomethyltransferase